MTSSSLTFEHVSFSYGKKRVVEDFSLNVEKGSFTTLLGPSGCGKTTLLRLVSGFLEPGAGAIYLDDENQCGKAPNLRKVAFVFQDYALFPHLTVADNILYGLRLQDAARSRSGTARNFGAPARDSKAASPKAAPRKAEKALREEKLHHTADVLGLGDLLARYPHELSGGQQQRVALARSIILEPRILLMDEPLSSLDAKLRIHVREELLELQQKLRLTTVYVTHDQEEALSLSTTVAVMDGGRLLQAGTPQEVYYRPRNTFVAEFTGRANFVEAGGETLLVRPEWFALAQAGEQDGGQDGATAACGAESAPKAGTASTQDSAAQKAAPTQSAAPQGFPPITGTVTSASFLGAVTRYKLATTATKSGVLTVDLPSTALPCDISPPAPHGAPKAVPATSAKPAPGDQLTVRAVQWSRITTPV